MKKSSLRPDPDWTAPRITVFVAGSGRSGSNLLCSAMSNTGMVGLPQEWLNLREMSRRHPRTVSTAADCCRMIVTAGTTPNGIAATKLLANHFLRLDGQIILHDWFPAQSWIYLRRRDRVGQAISRTIAVQTGIWAAGDGQTPRRPLPSYSREQIAANLAQIDHADRIWAEYFAAENIEPLTLWYEDLEQDLHAGITAVAKHVGGALLADELRTTPPFATGTFNIGHARQRTATNAEWRIRYMMGG